MKRNHAVLAIALMLVLILTVAGCSSKKAGACIARVWEFLNDGMTFTYEKRVGSYRLNSPQMDLNQWNDLKKSKRIDIISLYVFNKIYRKHF